MASEILPFTPAPITKFSLRFVVNELIIIVLLVGILLITLTSALIGWVVIPAMVSYIVPDQRVHLDFAINMFNTGSPPIAHFLYQSLVIGLHMIIQDANWLLSAVLANLIPQVFTAIIIYLALRACSLDFEKTWHPAQKWIVRCVCNVLAIGVLIAAPVFTLLTTVNGLPNQILLGFVTPVTYHNPTLTMLRPFALSLYLLITAYVLPFAPLQLNRNTSAFLVGLMITVTVLCGLSKPNYLLPVLPALCLWLVWSVWRRHPVRWYFVVIGVLLPIVVMLGWQYVFTFVNPTQELDTGGGLVFAPFKVVLAISGPSLEIMLMRFGVSILLPTVVYLLWWKTAKHNTALNFAWLTFIFGAFLMYFLAETGVREFDGNFFWSAYITIFILNVASVRFAFHMWLKSQQTGRFLLDWRTGFIIILFALHIMSGVYYIDWVNQWLYAAI